MGNHSEGMESQEKGIAHHKEMMASSTCNFCQLLHAQTPMKAAYKPSKGPQMLAN